jgi:thiol-disulfide isomerase/thioredoxin
MAPKKKGKTKRAHPVKNGGGIASPFDGMDVATEEDLSRLDELLKKNTVVVALIHADWCGHCQTFKPLWEDYKKIPGRNVPMVSINEKMLSRTPFKAAKINGFPSTVVYSGKDGTFGNFRSETGEDTNSVPNSRDKDVMIKILQTQPPVIEGDFGQESESLHPTRRAEFLLEKSGKKAIKEKDSPIFNSNNASPPKIVSDKIKKKKKTRRKKPARK